MSKTFYVLTAGSYSDYHIVDVTDDAERAEKLQRLYNWGKDKYDDDEVRVEEFPEHEEKLGFTVHLSNNGEVSGIIEGNPYNTKINTFRKDEKYCGGSVYVLAKNVDMAVAIAKVVFQYYEVSK